jgi:hypothetical protein
MKILAKQDFLKIQEPILYSNYSPIIFEGLFIKTKSLSLNNGELFDFRYNALLPPILSCEDDADFLFGKGNYGQEFDIEYDNNFREGLFDDEYLYAVYSKEDIKKLINELQELL